MDRKQIDGKYLTMHEALKAEYFDIVNEGQPDQHRVLKAGKSIDEFNQKHGDIWKAHEAELIAEGFISPPEPVGDLEAEIN